MIGKLNRYWIHNEDKPDREQVMELEKDLYRVGDAGRSGYLKTKRIKILGYN